MQAILLKLNDPKLSQEEILEIASGTKRNDVLLEVMTCFPSNENLILTIANEKLTVFDYNYAKENLNPGLVSKLKDIISEKLLNMDFIYGDENHNCNEIRTIFGPDHKNTKNMEYMVKDLDDCINSYDPDIDNEYVVWNKYHYMCGTIEGSRSSVDTLLSYWVAEDRLGCGHKQPRDFCDGCNIKPGVDNGNMLDLAIKYYSDDPEFVQRIKDRIDGGD